MRSPADLTEYARRVGWHWLEHGGMSNVWKPASAASSRSHIDPAAGFITSEGAVGLAVVVVPADDGDPHRRRDHDRTGVEAVTVKQGGRVDDHAVPRTGL